MDASLVAEGERPCPIAIAAGEMTLGRAPSNNVVADASAVSKVHARIERTADQLVLEDLGSANGTFVNGARVMTAFLQDGDVLSLAGVESYRVSVTMGEVKGFGTLGADAQPGGRRRPASSSPPSGRPASTGTRASARPWRTCAGRSASARRPTEAQKERTKKVDVGKAPGHRGPRPAAPAAAKPAAGRGQTGGRRASRPPAGGTRRCCPAAAKPRPGRSRPLRSPPLPRAKAGRAPAAPASRRSSRAHGAPPAPPPARPRRPSATPPSAPPAAAHPTPRSASGSARRSASATGGQGRGRLCRPRPAPSRTVVRPATWPCGSAAGRRPAPPSRPPRPRRAILEVRLTGPGFDLAAREPGAHELGRATEAPLRVNHPTVSRKHARIILADDRGIAYLQDAGGANGTRLNGKAIEKLAPLADGDKVGIGEVELTVTLRRG